MTAFRAGLTAFVPGLTASALHPYLYNIAAELGRRGVTANAVAPGFVAETEFFRGRMTAERRDQLVGQTLNHRAGEPGDIAAAVKWLTSPEAAHVTAQVIQVNGGAERGR